VDCLSVSGEIALPAKEIVKRRIQKENEKVFRTYRPSPRHTSQVDFYPYKHLLEKEMKRNRIPVRQMA
jgi:dimethylaniline monooxygenase (N-oxide forming)